MLTSVFFWIVVCLLIYFVYYIIKKVKETMGDELIKSRT